MHEETEIGAFLTTVNNQADLSPRRLESLEDYKATVESEDIRPQPEVLLFKTN
jgi:hypothetical protein